MAIDYQALKNWRIGDIDHHYTQRDVMLYALGVGIGADPVDPAQLRFVYEEGLCVLPSFALVMGYPGFWIRDPTIGVDWTKVLNVEQGIVMHRPLPTGGHVIGRNRVEEIFDKGADKGALVYTSRDVVDAQSGQLLCQVTQTIMCRGDGGFGGPAMQTPRPTAPVPDTPPTMFFDMKTLPQAALIYRLSGDYNPLHADPQVARSVGFAQPILHGAALFGIATYSLLRLLCNGMPAGLKQMNVRFSSPVYPGETVRTELWKTGAGQAVFRARVLERNVVALNGGTARFEA